MIFDQIKVKLVGKIPERERLVTQLKENGAILVDPDLQTDEEIKSAISTTEVEQEAETFYIVDSFEGQIFEELKGKGLRIIGPPCVYDSIKARKPFPKVDFPVYCRIFEDLCISYTENCKEVSQLIQWMNGTSQSEIYSNTNYLITSDVTSTNYQIAARRAISIVQPDWVHRCWQQKTLFDPQNFLLPPFSGCVITVTGLSQASRNMIEQLTSLYGGIFSSDATAECTHLISERPVGLKYKFAKTKGIKVVTPDWFYDSLKINACADARKYDVSLKYLPIIPEDKPVVRPINLNTHAVNLAFQLMDIIAEKMITTHTVCDLLQSATVRKLVNVRESCLKFISEHYEEIIKLDQFTKLSVELQTEIVASNSTTIKAPTSATEPEEELTELEQQSKKRKTDSL